VTGPSLFPIAVFQECTVADANELLVRWRHKMGALERPKYGDLAHVLLHEGDAVAVATTSTLIRTHAGAGLHFLTRENTAELSRLCASRTGLCRVMLRMWREFVFPKIAYQYAISYQDADLHNGNTYRFDGWVTPLSPSPLLPSPDPI
jgi:hypothetical protein